MSGVKFIEVGLDKILAPPGIESLTKRLGLFKIPSDLVLVTILLRPPILVPADEDSTGKKRYELVGNIRSLEWQIETAAQSGNREPSVMAVILDRRIERTKVGAIERFLVPLILGELSTRKAGVARRKLREAGVPELRGVDLRARLRALATGASSNHGR